MTTDDRLVVPLAGDADRVRRGVDALEGGGAVELDANGKEAVDAGDGSLIVVPNEKETTEVVVNHSAGNSAAPVTVDVWLPPDADVAAARETLERGEVTSARAVEITPEGTRVQVKAAIDSGADREAHEGDLRERAQAALREAGLLRSA